LLLLIARKKIRPSGRIFIVGDKGIVTDKFLLRQKFSATPSHLPLRGHGSDFQIPPQKQAVAFAYRPQKNPPFGTDFYCGR